MGVVYCVTNKINGKQYIGKSIYSMQKRKRNHENDAVKMVDSSPIFHRALRKHGKDNFDWEILFRGNNEEILLKVEIDFIKEENTKKPNGYNILDGGCIGNGKPMLGFKHSEETKRKMSKKAKEKFQSMSEEDILEQIKIMNKAREGLPGPRLGAVVSAETRVKMSKAQKGKKLTEEHKKNVGIGMKNSELFQIAVRSKERIDKIVKAQTGKKRSKETLRRMSEARKGKPWTEARRKAQENRKKRKK